MGGVVMLLTTLMWLHAVANAIEVYDKIEAKNDLIRELRLIPPVVATIALWCVVWLVLNY